MASSNGGTELKPEETDITPEVSPHSKSGRKPMPKRTRRRVKKVLGAAKSSPDETKKTESGREESHEWTREHSRHEARGRLKKRLKKLTAVAAAVILISAVIFVYFYFETFDTDGDGIMDWDDDDDDNDGLPDVWEELMGFDPLDSDDGKADTDSDNLTNKLEFIQGTDPRNPDTDGDGLLDGDEITFRTDPLVNDTDSDGMPDGWEVRFQLKPTEGTDANLDPDLDGVMVNSIGEETYREYTNIQEYENGTNPIIADTDGDFMNDGWELHYESELTAVRLNSPSFNFSFDPLDPSDGADDIDIDYEYNVIGDGLTNSQEFLNGTNPLKADSDGDELPDGTEVKVHGTDPNWYDSDGDLLSDGWESEHGMDPLSEDSDSDGINDTREDEDRDELTNLQEYVLDTNPFQNDTDGDGLPDGWEVEFKLDPLVKNNMEDPDSDMLTNFYERQHGTDPNNWDTDNDSLSDGEEVTIGWHGKLVEGVYLTSEDMPKYFSNPLSKDSDGDGIGDFFEIHFLFSNATDSDTDNDGLSDSHEDEIGTNASRVDSDMDGLDDTDELNGTFFDYYTNPSSNDTDKDGLSDGDEIFTDFNPGVDNPKDGTDPLKSDTDGDGIPDGWEAKFGKTSDYSLIQRYDSDHGTTLLSIADPDIDGIVEIPVWLVNPTDPEDASRDPDHDSYGTYIYTNLKEYQDYNNKFGTAGKFTDPLDWDTDGDLISDGWELHFAKGTSIITPDPLNFSDAYSDPDHDGVKYYIDGVQYYDDFTNLEEYSWGVDSDGDGIVDFGSTDPNDRDTDNSGTSDYDEIWFTDHDGDGLLTGWELLFNGTAIYAPDGYKPTFSGGFEKYHGEFNPFSNDSNGDSKLDGLEDPDGDSISNAVEHGSAPGTSPGSSDPTDSSSVPARGSSRSEFKGDVSYKQSQNNEIHSNFLLSERFILERTENNKNKILALTKCNPIFFKLIRKSC
jgi:hypothetical protein